MTETDPNSSPCSRCTDSCCRAVKHMPYQGETDMLLFSSLLVGSFPDFEAPDSCNRETPECRRPFVAEWLIPAEQNACPCLDHDDLCTIYEHRPLSCREFPVDSQGNRHAFCSLAAEFIPCAEGKGSSFGRAVDALDTLLYEILREHGTETLNGFLLEEGDTGIPMLYNTYLLCILMIAGADAAGALSAQMSLLESCRQSGLEEMTFLIPGTDYCITSVTAELEINLQYLMARMDQRALEARLCERLSEAGIIGR